MIIFYSWKQGSIWAADEWSQDRYYLQDAEPFVLYSAGRPSTIAESDKKATYYLLHLSSAAPPSGERCI